MPTHNITTRYYVYDQNNSGGSFDINDNVTVKVVIEAQNYREANDLAEHMGLYFDGRYDCPCCGNRWSPAWDDTVDGYDVIDTDDIVKYFTERHNKDEWPIRWTKDKQADVIIHNYDGTKTPIYFEWKK